MPQRYEIRADYDDATIVVYQAYGPLIAEPSLRAGGFVAPFSRTRMTWIKPSFAWMMHRCGWATKPGQEYVLALRLQRRGFDEALARACLSSYREDLHPSREAWQEAVRSHPVRVQWDPERTLRDGRLDHRSIQIGLGPAVVPSFVDEWIVAMIDATPLVRRMRTALDERDDALAERLRPVERPYPVPAEVAARLGIDAHAVANV